MLLQSTDTITRSYKIGNDFTLSFAESIAAANANGRVVIQDVIPATTPNYEKLYAFTRANIQSLVFYSNLAVTIYTNDLSSGSPQDTIPLVAGQVLVWTLQTDLIARCPVAGDVTKFYITNANGNPANLVIAWLVKQPT